MRAHRIALLLAAGLTVASCGDDGGSAEGAATFDDPEGFVGELEGTTAFVAVVADEDSVEVYACDGDAGISSRFVGEVDDPESFTITNDNGEEATVEFAGGAYAGSVTFADGSTHDFTTEPAEGDAGLFHAIDPPDDFAAGWVVLNDGRQHGSILFAGGGSLMIVGAPPIQGTSGQVRPPAAIAQVGLNFSRARP
jgi:hypothetical protein